MEVCRGEDRWDRAGSHHSHVEVLPLSVILGHSHIVPIGDVDGCHDCATFEAVKLLIKIVHEVESWVVVKASWLSEAALVETLVSPKGPHLIA